MINYLGSLTIGDACPGALDAAISGQVGINLALPDIQARLTALAAFSPQPIDFSVNLSIAQSIVTGISATIALGITPPNISAQIAIVAALVASLEASVSAVNGELAVCVNIQSLLGNPGVHTYSYAGAANAFGGEFTSELSAGLPGGTGGAQAINGVVLLTNVPGTWTAMQSIFST